MLNTGFEPLIFWVRSNRSAIWATTAALHHLSLFSVTIQFFQFGFVCQCFFVLFFYFVALLLWFYVSFSLSVCVWNGKSLWINIIHLNHYYLLTRHLTLSCGQSYQPLYDRKLRRHTYLKLTTLRLHRGPFIRSTNVLFKRSFYQINCQVFVPAFFLIVMSIFIFFLKNLFLKVHLFTQTT